MNKNDVSLSLTFGWYLNMVNLSGRLAAQLIAAKIATLRLAVSVLTFA